ncbi:MAG: nuclear transport factor 2 family protein [Anaerolineales bacterium]|nr:nuclear transport factor 2 family protein [Anaerolineales bacterium]
MDKEKAIAETIIAMEKAALERWGKGDPSGFLEISAPEVVYFDPYIEFRIDGLAALTERYESIRGQVYFDRFELLNPHVQHIGNVVMLTFNYVSYTGESESRWNCTEVYALIDRQWRIIQSHWSKTQPFNEK